VVQGPLKLDESIISPLNYLTMRPLHNCHFSVMQRQASDFNPQNTQCIPAVKIFAFLA
jgi:hypothetical protein